MGGFKFEILRYACGDLLLGALVTMRITAGSFLLALAVGVAVGVARSRSRLWGRLLEPYVEIFRGTPLLIQLFFIYYGLPTVGISMGAETAAYVGLGLNGGAYVSEIIRGAMAGVDRGQEEAAASTGLTPYQTVRHVLFPQAMRVAVPPLTNMFASMLKESSLVSILAITELTREGQLVYTRTFRAFEVYLAVGAMYFAMTYAVSRASRRLERLAAWPGSQGRR